MAQKFAVASSYYNLTPTTALDQVLAGGYVAIVKLSGSATTRAMYNKGNTSATSKRFNASSAENLSCSVGSTGTTLQATAPFANFAAYAVQKWIIVAARFSTALTNADQIAYIGSTSGALLPPSAYTTQTVGTAAYSSDAGLAAHIGDNTSATSGFTDSLAALAVFVGYPSFSDLQSVAMELQVRGRRLRLPSTVKGAWQFTGAMGTVPDLSGNGLHGVAGGGVITPVTDFVWRWEQQYLSNLTTAKTPPAVVPGTGLFAERRRRFIASNREFL